MRVIIIGLDNAGKTTILCKFTPLSNNNSSCFWKYQTDYIQERQSLQFQVSASLEIFVTNLFYNSAVGFNVETVTFNNLKLQVWDLGGQTGLRPYWRCYYQDTSAIVYVIDSADKERLEVARQEMELMLQEEELKGAPVLILANK